MIALNRIVLVLSVLMGTLVAEETEDKWCKIVIVGAGAAGIATAAKLVENGFKNIVVLEAQTRIGGRVNSVPFGKGYVDLGAQWCEGQGGNVIYELVRQYFEFGDSAIRNNNSYCYNSKGYLIDQNESTKLLNLSESITSDYENMAKFNKSYGEFFEVNYQIGLQQKEFEDIDKELADQMKGFYERGMNSLYASESWFDVSASLAAEAPPQGYQQFTWKEHGYQMAFDYLTKKLPDPDKELAVKNKVDFRKEVTNIDWSSNEVIVKTEDGSEYQADHVIVTVPLGFLKKHHLTLFTPQLPEKKINAIENTGFGTLGKIFLEFEEPFWPTDVDTYAAYFFLWTKEDKDSLIGTEREWLIDLMSFTRQDAQPNLLGGLVAGKKMKQFEEISDTQLIDDCMWLLEKFLGKTLPRPVNMQRSRWMTNKYFFGSYSFPSMETQTHNVSFAKDLGETIHGKGNKPILLIAGEATDELNSGYVHGAVSSGYRAADEILEYYKLSKH